MGFGDNTLMTHMFLEAVSLFTRKYQSAFIMTGRFWDIKRCLVEFYSDRIFFNDFHNVLDNATIKKFEDFYFPWWIVEPIYRQTIVINLRHFSKKPILITGSSWKNNPWVHDKSRFDLRDTVPFELYLFSKYKYALHLNHTMSYHQRVMTALLSGCFVYTMLDEQALKDFQTNNTGNLNRSKCFNRDLFLSTQEAYFVELFQSLCDKRTPDKMIMSKGPYLCSWKHYDQILPIQ